MTQLSEIPYGSHQHTISGKARAFGLDPLEDLGGYEYSSSKQHRVNMTCGEYIGYFTNDYFKLQSFMHAC